MFNRGKIMQFAHRYARVNRGTGIFAEAYAVVFARGLRLAWAAARAAAAGRIEEIKATLAHNPFSISQAKHDALTLELDRIQRVA